MKTPMAPLKLDSDPNGNSVNITEYRGMISSLLYLTASRPDIMFSTCLCARFQADPKESHLNDVKRIFRYLKGTPNMGLWYPKDSGFDLIGYSDSDFAGSKLDRKSTTGSCQLLGGKLVSWSSKKQHSVSTSTAEAEYVAAESCCAQILWMKNQLQDYDQQFTRVPILCDNSNLHLFPTIHRSAASTLWPPPAAAEKPPASAISPPPLPVAAARPPATTARAPSEHHRWPPPCRRPPPTGAVFLPETTVGLQHQPPAAKFRRPNSFGQPSTTTVLFKFSHLSDKWHLSLLVTMALPPGPSPEMSSYLLRNFWVTATFNGSLDKIVASVLSEGDFAFDEDDVRQALRLPAFTSELDFPLNCEQEAMMDLMNYHYEE
ncbi:hypothetical protein OSB04_002341 [Centaurea solstitialis]|uniref:Uncharacterized protein n=1 Tax=Centaurea solstitialis TaxID=347529 RepID=A0AA38WT54_9ASTR|nr:hypothetical protein OSB04_002341 [Centaurea solstitialis]